MRGVGTLVVLREVREDASLVGLLHLEVWTRHGRLKAPFLKKPCVGLWSGTSVVLVMNTLDSLQALESCRHIGRYYLMILKIEVQIPKMLRM